MPPSSYQRAELLLGCRPSCQPLAPLLPSLNPQNLYLCARPLRCEGGRPFPLLVLCLGLVLLPLSLLPPCPSQGILDGPPHQLPHLLSAHITAIGFP